MRVSGYLYIRVWKSGSQGTRMCGGSGFAGGYAATRGMQVQKLEILSTKSEIHQGVPP